LPALNMRFELSAQGAFFVATHVFRVVFCQSNIHREKWEVFLTKTCYTII